MKNHLPSSSLDTFILGIAVVSGIALMLFGYTAIAGSFGLDKYHDYRAFCPECEHFYSIPDAADMLPQCEYLSIICPSCKRKLSDHAKRQ